ncbi:MAG: phosphatidate cytidylyltransferase [Ruminococcaceae bacterium]|nr:phosphatidate cytidylyltransferase [Oscillospiraceae bacterium]
MKKRLISSAVGLGLLAVVVWKFEGLLLNAILFIVCLAVSYEVVMTFAGGMNLPLIFVASIFYAVNLFFEVDLIYSSAVLIFSFGAIATFSKGKLKIVRILASALILILFSTCFNSILFIRADSANPADGRFFFLFGLGLAWINDTFAYLIGRKFGKRKLCPAISPNKTIEGSVGGLSVSVIILTAIYFIYTKASSSSVFSSFNDVLSLIVVAVIIFIGSLIEMTGDLIFSCIKRELEIKDFGRIMPGHGGILDRFDGAVFTVSYIAFCLFIFNSLV